MKKTLLHYARTVWFVAFISIPFWTNGQILVQDFEGLNALSEFRSSNPGRGQVNELLTTSSSGRTTFSLHQPEGSGQTVMRLVKGDNTRVWWLKEVGAPSPEVLKLQFDLDVVNGSVTNPIGSFYVGHNMAYNATYPDNVDRFATIDINWNGNNRFSVRNMIALDQANATHVMNSQSTIAIYMNRSGNGFSYVSPLGTEETLANNSIDIWVDNIRVANDVTAQGTAPIRQVKFVTRGNDMRSTAFFDNLLIEKVPAYVPPVALDPAGGTYTVGSGGDFNSLTRPGGVFNALNELSTISGPMNFIIISDLPGETGEVALNHIGGTSDVNTIQFRPQNAETYSVTGSNNFARGALIRLNGADWVRFDGRTPSDSREGMGIGGHLLFRNTGAAPTFHLENDATNNTIAYATIQGASTSEEQAVVFLGNGTRSGNDANAILYNQIGGYGNQRPVNTLASWNAAAGNTTDDLWVEGNQFYGFAATASLNIAGNPCTIMAGPGNSSWNILGNHLYQERESAPVVSEGLFELKGVCIRSGTDHLVEGNFIGGSAAFAAGNPLRVTVDDDETGIPPYPSIVPFSIDTQNGKVEITGNTVTNIAITGMPFGCDDLAFGSVVLAGEVDFIDNTFGDPAGGTSITVRNVNSGDINAGSYLLAPVYYRGQSGRTSSGVVRGNYIGSVRLEGAVSGAGYSDLKFIGVYNNESASNIEISQNTIANIRSDVSGRLSVSMVGIHALGNGPTDIFRNVIYDFYNNSSALSVVCPSSLGEGNVAGIVAENISGETRVANNMITFEDVYPGSTTVYYGIFVPSNSSGATKVFYNSVYIYGGENAAIGRNYVFYRSGISPTTVRNNIFLNTRTTSRNANFVIGTEATAGWTSSNNLLYRSSGTASLNDFGRYGDLLLDDCSAWTASTPEQNSVCSENIESDFLDPANGNLRIVQTVRPSVVVDAGYSIEEIETDIDLVLRIDPDIGASEGYNAWIGVVSDDWFNPANWSANRVPDCPNNNQPQAYNLATILPNKTRIFDQEVKYQPVIRKEPGPANYRNLVILEGASVTMAEARAELRQCGERNPLIEGITNRGTIKYTGPGKISLRGVLNNEGVFDAGRGVLSLNGETEQFINSTEALELWRLLIEGGGPKNLQTPVLVEGALDLVEGVVLSTPDAMLTMGADATLGEEGSPANNAYVAGPMVKRFNSAESFVYPVGDEERLGLAAVAPVSSAPSAFVVNYHFGAAPYPLVRTQDNEEFFADGIEQVSPTEHWTIEPVEGNPAAQVVLYWDEASGIEAIENKAEDLGVVRWNASQPAWVDEGNSGTEEAPAPELGRLLSSPRVSGWGVFTFGSPNPDVPLPVEFTRFTASLEHHDVVLDWETSSEKNSSHFNVQRSKDGRIFNTIGRVTSAGNSTGLVQYQYTDDKVADDLAGAVYYRLEQVDVDGATDYSNVVVVVLPDEAFAIKGVYPNPFQGDLVVNIAGAKEQRLALRLLNMEGKQLLTQEVTILDGENIMPVLRGDHLQAGMYILEVSSAELIKQFKVIKK
ncbi:T9SS type A sorting domain-containing protein [Cesiribacter sp. SM1]|uniref:T9SS type A sorting domain-containing protein n=1 Tax=Cesiribacter sp. SM1 TaxID=2861196 RepID=UPI001CD7AFA6|nr:T9SS type A sorting domain-containing protein [Cesiribacter sp. SM1]